MTNLLKEDGDGLLLETGDQILLDEATSAQVYSYGSLFDLPTNADDLANIYTEQNITDVASDNAVRVPATGTSRYTIHEFKDQNDNNSDYIELAWNGQSSVATTLQPMYLEIYNQTSNEWEQVDSDNTTSADTDFNLTATINTNMTDYYDVDNYVTARVYQ
jgi:hypothetical protein